MRLKEKPKPAKSFSDLLHEILIPLKARMNYRFWSIFALSFIFYNFEQIDILFFSEINNTQKEWDIVWDHYINAYEIGDYKHLSYHFLFPIFHGLFFDIMMIFIENLKYSLELFDPNKPNKEKLKICDKFRWWFSYKKLMKHKLDKSEIEGDLLIQKQENLFKETSIQQTENLKTLGISLTESRGREDLLNKSVIEKSNTILGLNIKMEQHRIGVEERDNKIKSLKMQLACEQMLKILMQENHYSISTFKTILIQNRFTENFTVDIINQTIKKLLILGMIEKIDQALWADRKEPEYRISNFGRTHMQEYKLITDFNSEL